MIYYYLEGQPGHRYSLSLQMAKGQKHKLCRFGHKLTRIYHPDLPSSSQLARHNLVHYLKDCGLRLLHNLVKLPSFF